MLSLNLTDIFTVFLRRVGHSVYWSQKQSIRIKLTVFVINEYTEWAVMGHPPAYTRRKAVKYSPNWVNKYLMEISGQLESDWLFLWSIYWMGGYGPPPAYTRRTDVQYSPNWVNKYLMEISMEISGHIDWISVKTFRIQSLSANMIQMLFEILLLWYTLISIKY